MRTPALDCVLRLEDRQDDAGLREGGGVYAFLDLDAGVARSPARGGSWKPGRTARAERPPMRADTSTVLRAFFRPLNERLASLLGDEKFLWKDVKTGGGGVSRADVARHKLDDRATRGKPQPPPPQQQSLVGLVAAGDARVVLPNTSRTGAVTNVGDVLSVAPLTLDEPVLQVLLDHGLDANATEGLGKGRACPPCVVCQTAWGDSMKHSFVFALLANRGTRWTRRSSAVHLIWATASYNKGRPPTASYISGRL